MAELAAEDVKNNAGQDINFFQGQFINKEHKERLKDPVYRAEYDVALKDYKNDVKQNRKSASPRRQQQSSPKNIQSGVAMLQK